MNADILRSAGIDYDYCVKRFVGRANLFEKALSKFPKDDTFSRIRLAYEKNDKQELLANAHEFKGMCGNIGLTSLYEASDAIVKMLRSGSFSDSELSTAYERLEKLYKTVYNAVMDSMECSI